MNYPEGTSWAPPLKTVTSSRDLRAAFGRYPTGVAIVTALSATGELVGMTINSFASVSISPPMVGWCVDVRSHSYPQFCEAKSFTITVLSEDQQPLATRFATSGADKFAGLSQQVRRDDGRIPGGCAWFHCETYQRTSLGDHLMLIGRVVGYAAEPRAPLVFSNGRFQQLPGGADSTISSAA